MKKIYHSLSYLKQGLLAFAFTVFLSTGFSQTTYTFNYTGSVQTISLPAGNYSIECWGADGGNATNASSTQSPGGKGGYSRGIYANPGTTTFSVYVGGHGGNASGANVGSGGGGMSDVAITTTVIIVAGGGGGSTSGSTSNENSTGGDGGGLIGATALDGSGVTGGTAATGGSQTIGGSATAGSYGAGTPGGYGYGGGAANTGTAGVMHGAGGAGGNGGNGGWNGGGGGCTLTGINDHSGGGGAGYYGGGGGRGDGGAGGGGSSYIGGVSSSTTIMFGQSGFVTNPATTGDGYILIKELCSISLTATGLSAGNSICSGNSVTLTTDAVSNYSWSNGATTQSIVVFPTSSGIYSLSATSVSACNSSASVSITVNGAAPSLSIVNSATSSICLGKSATITASGALSYTWTGTSSPTPTNGLSFFPSTTSTYVVTGTNACGTTTAATSISIAPLLVAAATTSSLICSGYSATLSAFSAVSGYTWQPGNQQTSTFIVSPLANTLYTVTASDGTCVGTATVGISTNPVPTINIAAQYTTICLGSAVSLTASGGVANSYTWTSTPATSTIMGQSVISPSFPNPGAYAFYATGDNSFGCKTTNMQVVIVNAAPILTATATKTLVCSGGASTLNISGGDVYQWDSNANSATTQTVVVNPTNTCTYIVTSTLNATQCPATTSVVVLIYSPTITISSPTSACLGVAVTLTGSVNNPSSGSTNSYTWTGPGLPGTVGSNINVTPAGLTVYTLTARSTTGGNLSCTQTKTTSVGIAPNPVISVAPSRTYVCKGEPVNLIASGATTYTWNGNSLTGTTITVTHTNIATIPYTVTGTDANGCKNDTIYYLKINGCQGIQEFENNSGITVYPNPNNGEFYIVADKDLKLQLINELGQIIKHFELNAANQHKIQTADIAKGIYFIVDEKKAMAPQKIIVR